MLRGYQYHIIYSYSSPHEILVLFRPPTHLHFPNSLRVYSLLSLSRSTATATPPRSAATAIPASLLRQCKIRRRFSPEPSPALPSPPGFDFCFLAIAMSPFRPLLLFAAVFFLLRPLAATDGDADPLYMLVSLSLYLSIYLLIELENPRFENFNLST